MAAEEVAGVAIAVALFGAPVMAWGFIIGRRARHERAVMKEHARANRAHFAAVEAAEDDPIFSPDVIEKSVTEIVQIAGDLWRTGRSEALRARSDASLVRAWARSRQSWLSHDLEASGKPSVDLLQVINRNDEEEDRVVARVRVRIHCKDPGLMLSMRYVRLDERWTFGRSEGGWVLQSVGGDPLAGPVLTAPLVPNRSYDNERLREESLAELANAQKVGDDVDLSDLVDADEPPALALLDLSVVDGRFLPALIASELAHLLDAWEEAVTGSEAPLERLASANAIKALLRPSPGKRLVMRDAVLKSWEPKELDLSRRPPAIEVTLDVEAVRYVATDGGRYWAGNRTDSQRMSLRWILELTDSVRAPWRLATSNNAAEAIAGWP